MAILSYTALATIGLIWAMMHSPLGRAIGLSVDQFADASHRDRGELG